MSKETIKSILREGVESNYLGNKVTRPNQVLIIMRGIPGSGKSTKAKTLVGNGAIHSTDDVIERDHDYNQFFADMIASKDFSPLSKAHAENFKNAKKSMESGVSPVIIDNTNIRPDDAKKYVELALNMGYSDNNIKFVEVGTSGLSAQELADRNTHGVPLDKIEALIQSFNSIGPLSIKKVMDAKGHSNKKLAMIVLDDQSRTKLLTAIKHLIPEGWDVLAHHMTISFGKGLSGDQVNDLGKIISLRAYEIGKSNTNLAVKVDGYQSDNKVAHITIAVNTAGGGKPVMSNDITDWRKMDSYINLSGKVVEQKLG